MKRDDFPVTSFFTNEDLSWLPAARQGAGETANDRNRVRDLEKSCRELSEYTHTVSHDLKAPLRRIVQYCELLRDESGDRLGTDGKQYVDRLMVQSKRLQQLVEDLLAYAQVMQQGEEKRETDLGRVLLEVGEGLESLLEEHRAVINAGPLPAMLVYPSRMRQLFQNLIANAVKYHNSRDPVIDVSCEDRGNFYQFAFHDNGIGIELAFHQSIFNSFERLHAQDEIEGSGLGLAICAKVVEMHGGCIWVESEPGEGATFFFTLMK